MRFSARASKFGVLLFVSTLAIGSYFLTRNLRLVWLAHAQTTAPGFTALMVSHANYGTQQQSFIEEKFITVTADGAMVESYSLPGQPLSEFAVTVTSRDGHRTVSVGPVGLKAVMPAVPPEGVAKSNAYRARLRENGCVDSAHGERLLFHEQLLERWDAAVVQGPDFRSGTHQVHIHVWRIPALNCQQVQFESETEKDGAPAGSTFTKLVSLEFTSSSENGQSL